MTVVQQIQSAVTASPLAVLAGGTRRFYLSWFAYIFMGLAVFGLCSLLLLHHEPAIRGAIMDYLLPASWHGISERLFAFFFESQTRVVVASMMMSGSLVAASALLFPLKEYCSHQYELGLGNPNGESKEFPLWLQAWEETKLLFLYLTAQSVIFAIGYYPYEWCNWLSSVLGVLFLVYTFSLDLIAPTFQRHRVRYTKIIQLLVHNPVATGIFGAVFTLPLLFLGQVLLHEVQWSLIQTASALFLLNMLFLALAVPAGTLLASRMFPEVAQLPRLRPALRRSMVTATWVALLVSGTLHVLVARSMHHKSQFLKCEYDIDWRSLNLNLPEWRAWINGRQTADIDLALEIHNPTPFDLRLEPSHLMVWQHDYLVSTTDISALSVASGETLTQPLTVKTRLDARGLSDFSGLLEGWVIQLHLELLPGIPLMIPLYESNANTE